jgi:Tfp pilus assembly protein PilF
MLILAMIARSFAQCRHWRDDFALSQHELSINPNSYMGHADIAFDYWQRRDREKAELHAKRAIEIRPGAVGMRTLLGRFAIEDGRFDEAISLLTEALMYAKVAQDVDAAQHWLAIAHEKKAATQP